MCSRSRRHELDTCTEWANRLLLVCAKSYKCTWLTRTWNGCSRDHYTANWTRPEDTLGWISWYTTPGLQRAFKVTWHAVHSSLSCLRPTTNMDKEGFGVPLRSWYRFRVVFESFNFLMLSSNLCHGESSVDSSKPKSWTRTFLYLNGSDGSLPTAGGGSEVLPSLLPNGAPHTNPKSGRCILKTTDENVDHRYFALVPLPPM